MAEAVPRPLAKKVQVVIREPELHVVQRRVRTVLDLELDQEPQKATMKLEALGEQVAHHREPQNRVHHVRLHLHLELQPDPIIQVNARSAADHRRKPLHGLAHVLEVRIAHIGSGARRKRTSQRR